MCSSIFLIVRFTKVGIGRRPKTAVRWFWTADGTAAIACICSCLRSLTVAITIVTIAATAVAVVGLSLLFIGVCSLSFLYSWFQATRPLLN